jgi:regulator of protease activity HflC (stomatin/prohibitin superfamily)
VDQRVIRNSTERSGAGLSGGIALVISVALLLGAVFTFLSRESVGMFSASVLALLLVMATLGFYALQPNEAAVITLFGRYVATDRRTGLRCVPSENAQPVLNTGTLYG